MPKATLVVLDQCNVRFRGLDPHVRDRMNEALKFVVPNAQHMPLVKLGRWDGTVSFCSIGGSTFLNVLDRVLPIITAAGYDIDLEDRRPSYHFSFPEINESLFADRRWPAGHPMAGEPIVLRDYQVAAIRTFIEHLQSVQQICTGSGKTILTAALSHLVEPYGRSIVIVPSKNLVVQTEEDYRNLGLDVGVLYGERKEWGHQHSICTWQSLASLDKQKLIQDFVKDVICVMTDECFDGDTPVLTPSGWKQIREMHPGDKVLNRDEGGNIKVDTVVRLHTNLAASTEAKMYELTMDDGSMVRVTGNHKFLTDQGWVRADQLTDQHDIVSAKYVPGSYSERDAFEDIDLQIDATSE